MIRALFEGVVFEHRRHIEALRAAGVGFERVFLSGGGARSPHWPQMFSDCLNVPIAVAEAEEAGALGAAIGGAIATGHVAGFEDGLQRMTRTRGSVRPNPTMKEHYEERYQTYLSLAEAMKGFWATLEDRKAGL